MRRNVKLHAVAIASICAIITLLYVIIDPQPKTDQAPLARGDRYIQIYSASWGLNCNSAIQEAIKNRSARPITPNAPQPAALALVTANNALPALTSTCDGRLTCELPVNTETMGGDPLPSCFKRLTLSYRCFSYDRLWNLDLPQGSKLAIDCNKSADATRK